MVQVLEEDCGIKEGIFKTGDSKAQLYTDEKTGVAVRREDNLGTKSLSRGKGWNSDN